MGEEQNGVAREAAVTMAGWPWGRSRNVDQGIGATARRRRVRAMKGLSNPPGEAPTAGAKRCVKSVCVANEARGF